jgi:pimeloyl-ACP methyl ester carboxylesterase
MKPVISVLIACTLLLACERASPTRSGHEAEVSSVILSDPPRDAAHPAKNRQLLIPSRGSEMNALFFLASGEGPKPTVLLLHGLPGNERNLDLAQAMRRAGWNVLTFTYRGAWGSQGRFSISNALEDTQVALDFLRSPETVQAYNVDANRVVIVGHSMGGLAAAFVAASDENLAGVVLVDAWNAGAEGAQIRAGGAQARTAAVAELDDLGHALQGATADTLVDELVASSAWDLTSMARGLASKPILMVSATDGLAAENRQLAAAVERQPGSQVRAVEIQTDHSFADHRIALAAEVVQWLRNLRQRATTRAPQGSASGQ